MLHTSSSADMRLRLGYSYPTNYTYLKRDVDAMVTEFEEGLEVNNKSRLFTVAMRAKYEKIRQEKWEVR